MLKVVNLTKVYRPKKGQAVVALDHVNLEIEDKGLVFLLGKSGSGKSTLLNLLGGLDTFTDGDILIKGKSTKDFNQSGFDSYRNTFIGFIFQEFNILEEYSVGQNIGMALELQHRTNNRAEVEQLLAQVDLDGYYERKPNELSGGQKQRIAIARALIKKPEIIMADEPTGALDSKTGKSVFDTLKKISETKLVMVVTHDRENAEIYADRIIELADGKVIADRVRSAQTGVLEEKDVTFVNEKLIRIKAGKALEPADMKKISEMVLKSRDDVYISLDNAANVPLKAKADSAIGTGVSGTFVPTTPDKIKAKQYDPAEFKLVKSRLPFKDSVRMGVSGLKHKKVRLVFTIFLSFIAFVMAGFSTTVSLFNRNRVELDTFKLSGSKNVLVQSLLGEDYGFSGMIYDQYKAPGLGTQQLADLFMLSGSKPMRVAYKKGTPNLHQVDLQANLADYPVSAALQPVYYATALKRLVEVPSAEEANLTPIGNSRLPKSYKEIAISDYLAETFIKYGYSDNEGTKQKIEKQEDLIGKTVGQKDGSGIFTITGVFKTETDKNAFEKYKNDNKNDEIASMTFDYSSLLMGMGYVMPGFSNEFDENSDSNDYYGQYDLRDVNKTAYIGAKQLNSDNIDTDQILYQQMIMPYKSEIFTGPFEVYNSNKPINLTGKALIINAENFKSISTQYYAKFSELLNKDNYSKPDNEYLKEAWDLLESKDKIVYAGVSAADNPEFEKVPFTVAGLTFKLANGEENEELQKKDYYLKNSLIVSPENFSSIINSIMKPINFERYSLGLNNSENSFVTKMSGYHAYSNIRDVAKQNIYWGENGSPKATLANNEIIISYNTLLRLYSRKQTSFSSEVVVKQVFDAISKDAVWGISIWGGDKDIIESGRQLKIVGCFIENIHYSENFISDNFLNDIGEVMMQPLAVVVNLSDNNGKNNEILNYIANNEIKGKRSVYKLAISTTVTPILDMAISALDLLKSVFMVTAIVFSIFSALLLMNFIGTSISIKKKDIGVLRAIGARGADVFKIFFSESFVIGAINFVLAAVGLGIVSVVVNQLLGIAVMSFHVFPYLLMAGLSVVIAAAATYLPVRKIARKKPIDAINNR